MSSDFFYKAGQCLYHRKLHCALYFYTAAERSGYSPDACAGARWLCHMLLGDYQSAWFESDSIWARGNPDPNRFWNRKPLNGKRVLIRCLHGLGDTIQYLRYLPLLRRIAKSVSLEAQPQLKSLLSAANVADHVFTWGEPEPPLDEQIEIVELPLIFRSTLENLPADLPYLSLPENGGPIGGDAEPQVGFLWASSEYNRERWLPASYVIEMANATPARCVSFQPDPARSDLHGLQHRIEDGCSPDNDILETGRRLLRTDLLITVDSMLAHLAGALGIPVWLLLPYAADWRWMVNRSDSPWYPTMRLFRQMKRGDWAPVVRIVKAELKDWYSRAARSHTTPVEAPDFVFLSPATAHSSSLTASTLTQEGDYVIDGDHSS